LHVSAFFLVFLVSGFSFYPFLSLPSRSTHRFGLRLHPLQNAISWLSSGWSLAPFFRHLCFRFRKILLLPHSGWPFGPRQHPKTFCPSSVALRPCSGHPSSILRFPPSGPTDRSLHSRLTSLLKALHTFSISSAVPRPFDFMLLVFPRSPSFILPF